MVEKWKLALKEFLKEYEDDDDVIGAILSGSYAAGNPNESSDIDVCLILKDGVNYQERGIKESNSYLIEYFMNPVSKYKEYLDSNQEEGIKTMAFMLGYGKIIYDIEGSALDLQKLALDYVDKPLDVIDEYNFDKNNYYIWDDYNELKQLLTEESPSFFKVYYGLIDRILNSYYMYLELPILPSSKVYKILTNKSFRTSYHIFKVPEDSFIKIYKKCFDIDTMQKMFDNITELINYYYDKTGDFNIRNFKLRREIK